MGTRNVLKWNTLGECGKALPVLSHPTCSPSSCVSSILDHSTLFPALLVLCFLLLLPFPVLFSQFSLPLFCGVISWKLYKDKMLATFLTLFPNKFSFCLVSVYVRQAALLEKLIFSRSGSFVVVNKIPEKYVLTWFRSILRVNALTIRWLIEEKTLVAFVLTFQDFRKEHFVFK